MRSILLILLLLAIPSGVQAEPATRVVLFAPFGGKGVKSDLKVTSRAHGSCWIQSLASGRSDAWRCFIGNIIHDPCFSNVEKTRVACSENPFSKTIIVIELNKPLPYHEGESERTPWALQLANGERCIMVTGATDVIAGMRLNYACDRMGWVIGDVDTSGEPWRAFYVNKVESSAYVRVSVREAIL